MTYLQQQYFDMSKDRIRILNDIKTNWDQYPDYLGWLDLNSPIIDNPDILFIGINPGPGRYVQWNWNNWDNKKKRLIDPLKKKLPDDYHTLWRSHIEWLKPNNARKDGEWWDSNKKKFNHYSYYMCELLVRIYRNEYPYPSVSRQELSELFEKKVMVTNLYPMSTFDIRGLYRLIKQYRSKKQISISEICCNHITKLIELVSPRCIVLLGATIDKELSGTLNVSHLPYYCINRDFGWHSKDNIKSMANDIYKLMR